MPPENTDPVAKTQPAELDFDAPAVENPRIKKRSLKGRATTPPTQASPTSSEPSRAPVTPDQPRATTQAPSSISGTTPSPTGYVRPGTAPGAQQAKPSEPSGVLYYSNSLKEASARPAAAAPASRPASTPAQPVSQRPAPTTMQPSSTSRPASTPQQTSSRPIGSSSGPGSHATQQAPTSRPAGTAAPSSAGGSNAVRTVSTTVAGPSAASRPGGGVSDYRANIERQSREQKSIGGILNLIVYGLIAIFILGAGLAAYGAHVIFKQLNAQSITVSELDSRYSAANQELNAQLKTTAQAVLQLQEQVNRDQDLTLKQQDAITKLDAQLATDTELLRQERTARATETSIRISETAALRARLRAIESRDQSNYHP